MRLARFFASGGDLRRFKELLAGSQPMHDRLELAEDDLIKQLRSVLRLGQGHHFILLDGDGGTFEFEIERVEKTRVICFLCKKIEEVVPSNINVSVGLALIKADRFEWCLEKLTEIGVNEIVPILTQHCVAKIDINDRSKTSSKLLRWQAIAKEAAEQCERSTIPPVVIPRRLSDYLDRPTSGGTSNWKFICAERSGAIPLVKALEKKISIIDVSGSEQVKNISILIGPEGGFSNDEFDTARRLEWQAVTLGSRILRSETAAIVAMSQVASVLDI